MSIENYQNMLMEIEDKLLNNKLKYKNSIIIGDNSSGKSEIIKNIFHKRENDYYLIDSINRKFDYSRISGIDSVSVGSYKNVVKSRLKEDSFNLKDTFDLYGTGGGAIEEIYFNYDEKLKKLFEDFLGVKFDIKKIKDEYLGEKIELRIGKDIDKISNGYQAILRIFLEILYFKDSLNENVKYPVVVIDEINEFLSAKNEEKILPFLMKEFNEFSFIITTHSAEVIVSSMNCNILVLSGSQCEYLDGNDYTSITDTMEIFQKLYKLDDVDGIRDDNIESILRSLLNLKIGNQWTKVEEEKLKSINEDNLSNAHKLLIQQIKSW